MDKKSIGKLFWKYVSLNVMSMIGLSCFIFVDTLCVANGVGSNGLTALNLTLPVYSLINGIGLMIGMGGATRFSMDRGTGNTSRAKEAFTHSMRLAVVVGIIFFLIGLVGSESLALLLGADEEVLKDMIPYMKTIILFSPAFMVNNVMVCFVRNDSDPQTAMAAMLTGSFSNIVLDLLFVFVFKWGMFGAAFATGIAPILSLCVASSHVLRGRSHFGLVRVKAAAGDVIKILSLGTASFITELSSGIVMLLFNFTILGLAGSIGVAAYGVIANIALIVVAVFTGIAQGVQPIISTQYGRKEFDKIKYVKKKAVVLALALGALFYLAGALLAEPIIAIFNEAKDAGFHDIAMKGIFIYFIAFIPMGINIVMSSVFASVDKPVQSMGIALSRGMIFNVALIFVLPLVFGMTGVWTVVPAAELMTLCVCLFIVFRENKKTEK